MLFHSTTFILGFLPAMLLGFFVLGRHGHVRAALAWITFGSFVFYGWFEPTYALLLGASVLFNYAMGRRIGRARSPYRVLVVGVCANLALLGYFKYADFFLESLAWLGDRETAVLAIALPIGISFFTFQNIAYLVDSYRNEARAYDLLEYALFCSFFPQLIAGPIVHHAEMISQFRRPEIFRPDADRAMGGAAVFLVGMFKKVVVADQLALFANPVFGAAAAGGEPAALAAWGATLAFSLQIYFDFSGYTDMAIGIAGMFGIALPNNFASPYKAASIIDFWRRWHMTLSRFLRDYVYFPLGGNRLGTPRRYTNLMLTMLVGGLWHGAAWTFVVWGGLHGVFLVINHAFRWCRRRVGFSGAGITGRLLATAFTTFAVAVSWVFFRAESFPAAMTMLAALAGEHGLGASPLTPGGSYQAVWLTAGLASVWWLPNTIELFAAGGSPSLRPLWRGRRVGLLPSALLFTIMIFSIIGRSLDAGTQQFIYFQF